MKWSEFKKYVDQQIKDIGNNQDPNIEYIDVHAPDISHPMTRPDVVVDDDGMAIF